MDNTRYFTAYRGLYFYCPMQTCVYIYLYIYFLILSIRETFVRPTFWWVHHLSIQSNLKKKHSKCKIHRDKSGMCFTILFLFLTETNCIIYLNSIFKFSFSEIIQSNQVSQNLFQSKYIFFLYWPYNDWYTIYIYKWIFLCEYITCHRSWRFYYPLTSIKESSKQKWKRKGRKKKLIKTITDSC